MYCNILTSEYPGVPIAQGAAGDCSNTSADRLTSE